MRYLLYTYLFGMILGLSLLSHTAEARERVIACKENRTGIVFIYEGRRCPSGSRRVYSR